MVLKDDKNQYQDKEPKEKSFACTNTVHPACQCYQKNCEKIFGGYLLFKYMKNEPKSPCVCDHLPRRNRDPVNIILTPKPDKCKIMIMCGLMIFNKKYNYVWFDDFQQTSQELRMLSSVTINCQITKIVMNSGSQLSEL